MDAGEPVAAGDAAEPVHRAFEGLARGENQCDRGDFVLEIPVRVRPVLAGFFGDRKPQDGAPAVSAPDVIGDPPQVIPEAPFEEADLDGVVVGRLPLPLARLEKGGVEDAEVGGAV
ncbi:MAG: hypothetical protein A3G34_12785 [Candidatus Lindowbacteria bacterium RIFCSPLOWO2_12_FULL_62_27]|nr:MAG: hypothetical protein A3G34_12785 [Candidatus Lindowbacteria bacterium RIFCSPLOWO2_12_FULL_62_27]